LKCRSGIRNGYDSHEDTSMKKCTKYYDYQDSDVYKQKAILNLSMSNKLNYSSYLTAGSRSKKSKGIKYCRTQNIKGSNKSSRESDSILRPVRAKKSISLMSNSQTTKPTSSREELKYYKKICAEMRKKNT
jgi:hypothetical protein